MTVLKSLENFYGFLWCIRLDFLGFWGEMFRCSGLENPQFWHGKLAVSVGWDIQNTSFLHCHACTYPNRRCGGPKVQ